MEGRCEWIVFETKWERRVPGAGTYLTFWCKGNLGLQGRPATNGVLWIGCFGGVATRSRTRIRPRLGTAARRAAVPLFFRRCGAVIPTKSTLSSQLGELRNSGGPRSPPSTNYPGSPGRKLNPTHSPNFPSFLSKWKVATPRSQPSQPSLGRAWLARKERAGLVKLCPAPLPIGGLATTPTATAKRARLPTMKLSAPGAFLPSSTTVRCRST